MLTQNMPPLSHVTSTQSDGSLSGSRTGIKEMVHAETNTTVVEDDNESHN